MGAQNSAALENVYKNHRHYYHRSNSLAPRRREDGRASNEPTVEARHNNDRRRLSIVSGRQANVGSHLVQEN